LPVRPILGLFLANASAKLLPDLKVIYSNSLYRFFPKVVEYLRSAADDTGHWRWLMSYLKDTEAVLVEGWWLS
jgi:hypothetical protein